MANMPNNSHVPVQSLPRGKTITFVAVPDKIFHNGENYQKQMKSIRVAAPLPETFTFSIGNEVNQTWDFMQFKSAIIQTIAPTVGKNFDRGLSERQFWRGVENQEMTVELNFNAFSSAREDVFVPTRNLMLLGAAAETSFKGGEKSLLPFDLDSHWDAPPLIRIWVGDYIRITNAIIKNVSVAYSNKLDANHYPMSATASVTFITQDPIGYVGLMGYGGKYSGFAPPTSDDTYHQTVNQDQVNPEGER